MIMDAPRVPLCTTTLLAALSCVSLVASVCAAPFDPRLSVSRRHLGEHGADEHEQPHQAADPAKYPDRLTGKPIPFNWGFEAVTDDLAADAARYEDELSMLLDGPLSDWQEGCTFAARPIEIAGEQEVVIYGSYQYSTPGGRAFFEYLMTPEGQKLMDPSTDDMAKSRAASKTIEGPNGVTVYPVAQITKLPPPSPIPSVIFEGAVHWQMCGEHQLTEFTYPAHVPVKDRLPNVQELSGKVPEYTIIYAIRVRQLDAKTIQMSYLFWNSLLRGSDVPAALQALEQPGPPFDASIRKHLERTSYAPETGDECETEYVKEAVGIMADVETSNSVLYSSEP